MNPRTFSLVAGIVFLAIAVAHLFRVLFEVAFVVAGIDIPMSASAAAAVVMAYLAYEAFRQRSGTQR